MYKVAFSPSQQVDNAYTGVTTTEKIEMEKLAQACHKYHVAKGGEALTFAYPKDVFDTRPTLAKDFGAEAYIALHTNGGGGSGTETFYAANSPNSKKLCTLMNDRLTAYFEKGGFKNTRSGPVQMKSLYEVTKPASFGMPHCYIEVNFHDNAPIAKYMVSRWDAIAKVIVDTIWEFKGWVEKVPVVVAPDKIAPDFYYYRVCLSSYKSRNAAYDEVARLSKENGLSAFVAYVNTPTKK